MTESLTLIAGTLSLPSFNILCKLCTPVVVSSDKPAIPKLKRLISPQVQNSHGIIIYYYVTSILRLQKVLSLQIGKLIERLLFNATK